MKNKSQFTKICPKCGNIDLPIITGFVEILAPTPEKCKKCGYAGLFPEIDINELQKTSTAKQLKFFQK